MMEVKTDVYNIRSLKFPKEVLRGQRIILVPIGWQIENYKENDFTCMDFIADVPELRSPLVLDFSAFDLKEKRERE